MSIRRQDIRDSRDDEKAAIYEAVHCRWMEGERGVVREHRSGFPAVTVDCGDIHILSDVLSLEAWWGRRHPPCPWTISGGQVRQTDKKEDTDGE